MFWIIDNFNVGELLWLALFPIVALIFQYNFTTETIKKILIITSILVLPIFSGYDFMIGWFYEFCITIILGGFFSFLLKGMEKTVHKVIPSMIISILLFIIIGYIGFFQAFGGSDTSVKKWNKANYTIRYRISQGFSGKPYEYYAVYHTPLFGLFNKKIQSKSSSKDKNSNCIITFEKAKVEFDKCEQKIIKTP